VTSDRFPPVSALVVGDGWLWKACKVLLAAAAFGAVVGYILGSI
jgi:hypothetical protein